MDICYECQELMVAKQGPITLTKTGYGSYEVPGVLHYSCDKCGAKVILPEEAERVETTGVKLHMMKVLSCKGSMTALALKEEVLSNVELLEKAALQLVAEKKINIDYTNPNEPVVSILDGTAKLSRWERIKDWFKRNKHNFY